MPVYFIKATGSGFVKVGHSRNVRARLAALQTSNFDRLELIGDVPGSTDVEREIHKRLASYRVDGTEWFRGVPEAMSVIQEALLNPPTVPTQTAKHPALQTIRDYISADKTRSYRSVSEALNLAHCYLHGLVNGKFGCSVKTADAIADRLVADGWIGLEDRYDFWAALIRLKSRRRRTTLAAVGS